MIAHDTDITHCLSNAEDAFIRGHHALDLHEGLWPALPLQQLQCLQYKIPDAFPACAVAQSALHWLWTGNENVEDRQNLQDTKITD